MKSFFVIAVLSLFVAAILFFAFVSNTVSFSPGEGAVAGVVPQGPHEADEAAPTNTAPAISSAVFASNSSTDLPPQPQLANPPTVVEGLYMTGWSAGSETMRAHVENVVAKNNFNAVVIDIKDYSGYVSYHTGVPEIEQSGAEDQIRIRNPDAMIKELHDKGIYVIGRVSTFQDPVLAKAHPEWAMQSKSRGTIWHDNKGLAWMDAGAPPVWDYNIALAKDALARGFDEINFDYVRFPSDGDLADIKYPYSDPNTPLHDTVAKFFAYVKQKMPGERVSADLFGLSTSASDDLGIGQIIEDGYKNFDYVSPMVYPSHYAPGTLGYKNPAQHPYEVVHYAMEHALARLEALNASSSDPAPAKIRPWLQVFDLGATYDRAMVEEQVQAVKDVLAQHADAYSGFLFWDPKNTYTPLAL